MDDRISIIYCRQSLDKKDSLSVEGQEDKCKLMLFNEPYELYIDKGYSGKSINRPAFNKVLELIKKDKVKKLVTYRLDRLSRSIIDFSSLVKLFEEHDVTFISSSENIDLSSAAGKLMANILSVFAEFERNSIQERITDSYYKRLESGIFPGGSILGYDIIKTNYNGHNVCTLKENEDIEIIRRMFDLYSKPNVSLHSVTMTINKEFNKKYHVTTIGRSLRNPIYVKANLDIYNYYKLKGITIINPLEDFCNDNGCFIINKKEMTTKPSKCSLYLSIHKGTIEPDVFIRLQKKLDSNKTAKRKNKGHKTWLVNLKCNKCNHTAKVMSNTRNSNYIRCIYRLNTGGCKGLSNIKLEDIEELVNDSILKKLESLKESTFTPKQKVVDKDIAKEILRIESEIATYIEKVPELSGKLLEMVNEKVNQLEYRKIELQNELLTMEDESDYKLGELIEKVDWDKLDLEGKREVALALIDSIKVDDSDLYIEYKV